MAEHYWVADDADGEPTLWVEDDHPHRPLALLRRCDLPSQARYLWPRITTALTAPDQSDVIFRLSAQVEAFRDAFERLPGPLDDLRGALDGDGKQP